MKKQFFAFSCLLLAVSIVGYGTMAYFTAEKRTTNTVTTGYVQMSLYETAESADTEIVLEPEVPSSVVPGDSVAQTPYVENTGSEPFYARVKLQSVVTFADGTEKAPFDVLEFDIGSKWIDGGDGWYYYTEIVGVDDKTDPLFTEITFPLSMGNEYLGAMMKISLNAQSVQAEHNGFDATAGESVLDVKGWPEDTTP